MSYHAPMAFHIDAKVPRKGPSPANGKRFIDTFLLSAGAGMQKEMSWYPVARPWKSPPPKHGLRAGGRRTGNYGRNWRITAKDPESITISNPISYAPYVGGSRRASPGQARSMEARNWRSVDDVIPRVLKKSKADAMKVSVWTS